MHVFCTPAANVVALARFGLIHRTIRDEPNPREFGDDALAFGHAVHRLGDHFADHGGGKIPLFEDRADVILVSEPGDDEHALLRLAEEQLVRGHPRFARGDLERVDDDTDVAAREPGMTPYELLLSESQERM